jgi:SAM-dependent methyltransferase
MRRLTPEQEANYCAVELRENMAAEIRRRFPKVQAVTGDCQARLDFPDGHFDRYIAVHVLEHLPNLPACIREAYRLLNKERGQMLIVIPCEGSPAYSFARKISAERVYNRHFRAATLAHLARAHQPAPRDPGRAGSLFHGGEEGLLPLPVPAVRLQQPLHRPVAQAAPGSWSVSRPSPSHA